MNIRYSRQLKRRAGLAFLIVLGIGVAGANASVPPPERGLSLSSTFGTDNGTAVLGAREWRPGGEVLLAGGSEGHDKPEKVKTPPKKQPKKKSKKKAPPIYKEIWKGIIKGFEDEAAEQKKAK